MKKIREKCLMWGTALLAFLAGNVQATQVEVSAALATPVVQAGKSQTAFLKVSLTGFALPEHRERPPVNVAIVIDRSGSMSGEKMRQAREAATLAVHSLAADDIVSVIAFDDRVEVVTPATRATDKHAITQAIARIDARGSTAIFAGVSKGASEIRKFIDRNRVNRVILLSDGQANAGPSSPAELGRLGGSLAREGISVSTIGLGLGYNEDLMTQLAGYSDGNHAFVANAQDLARIFKLEFGDVTSMVAQDVDITIRLARGTRPVRVLGRDAEIVGNTVRTRMRQLGSEQEKFVMLEVEVPAGTSGAHLNVADVDVGYLNMVSKRHDAVKRMVAVSYTDSAEKVALATNKKVMKSAVEQVANTLNAEALQLRDDGKIEDAKRVLNESADYLYYNAQKLDAPELKKQEQEARKQAETIDKSGEWNNTRKVMKEQQHKLNTQQKY